MGVCSLSDVLTSVISIYGTVSHLCYCCVESAGVPLAERQSSLPLHCLLPLLVRSTSSSYWQLLRAQLLGMRWATQSGTGLVRSFFAGTVGPLDSTRIDSLGASSQYCGSLAALLAGANGMPPGRFFFFNMFGGACWACLFGFDAYAVGIEIYKNLWSAQCDRARLVHCGRICTLDFRAAV